MIAFPSVQLNAGLGRGAIFILAAGLGVAVGAQYVAPAMPAAVQNFDIGVLGVNGTTLTIAATALVFAAFAAKIGA